MTSAITSPSRPQATSQAHADAPAGASAYLPTLDGWRTVAIGLVLFAHASESMFNAIPISLLADLAALKKIGLIGVQLFFGLSGFLITTRLLEEETHHGRISLASFYVRRTFRILPASLAFLLAVGLLSAAGILHISLARWFGTLFFAANYSGAEHSWYVGHFWSLAVEEHFYFLWPAAFLFLRGGSRRVTLVVFLALAIAAWRALDFKWQITGASAAMFWGRTDIQADSILWGVLVALLYADPVWKERLRRFFAPAATWPLLFLLLLALEGLPALNWKADFLLITVKAMLMPLLMLGTVIHGASLPGRILETRLFRRVGRLSFSLYLWQQLFLVWAEDRAPGMGALQTFPLNLVAVFACAMLSMLWIETPFIAIGHKIAKRIPRR